MPRWVGKLTDRVVSRFRKSTAPAPQKSSETGETEVTPLYNALNPSRSEIRVLEIFRSSDNASRIECRLLVSSLKDGSWYAALSYVWGDTSITENIVVNGNVVAVTSNLVSALRGIRRFFVRDWERQASSQTHFPFRLWVDAICINQNDKEERNEQVKFMTEIYQSAGTVIAWLGPGNEHITRTLRTIKDTHQHMAFSLRQPTSLDWMQAFPQISDDNGLSDFFNGTEALSKLPYWNRVWIIQEMAFAKLLCFMSADSDDCLLGWHHFNTMRLFMDHLKAGLLAPADYFPVSLWIALSAEGSYDWRTMRLVAGHRSLISDRARPRSKTTDLLLFGGTASHLATDPRDKIYALLGLMDLDIPIDYSDRTTVRDVYGAFAGKWVDAGSVSELLLMSGIGWDLVRTYNLPSWVPDWQALSTAPAEYVVGFQCRSGGDLFNANRSLQASAWRVDDSFDLHCRGCTLGSLAKVKPRWQGPEFPSRDYIFDTCVEIVTEMGRSRAKLIFPPLGTAFRTLFMDTDPGHSGKGLCSDLSRAAEVAKTFVGTILSTKDNKAENLEHFKLLGFDSGNERFEDFFQRELLPGMDNADSSEYSYESVQMLDIPLMGAVLCAIVQNLMGKRIFYTSDGRTGLGPVRMEKNDLLCVLDQCKFPVILRRVDSHYLFVGCAYVLGLMDGEMASLVEKGEATLEELVIR